MEHTNRTIRPLTQQDLEAYLDIYLNAYPAYKTLDEACREHYREKHRLELREDRQVQTVGLFEGDVLIATMKLILFSMNCFGRMQTACGLMALEVHPLHKKPVSYTHLDVYKRQIHVMAGEPKAAMLALRVEKPPVEMVAKEWTTAS